MKTILKNQSFASYFLLAWAFVSLLLASPTYAQHARAHNMVLQDSLALGYNLANIWGYVDETKREYALVGTTKGLTVVDVSNPQDVERLTDLPANESLWREVKTWKDYAYVVTEAGGGLMIVDLRPLPQSTNLPLTFYKEEGIDKAHALFIDDDGYCYLFGSNLANGGAVILDLNADPLQPKLVGKFDTWYIHDGYVRNNMLYAAHVYNGFFSIVDVRNKAKLSLLSTQNTPSSFTHNTWLSKNSSVLFTTDERQFASLTAYDVSNPQSPLELDRVQSLRGAAKGTIPHNVHVVGDDYLATAWYTDGVLLHDASRPHNLIEIGYYDTSPAFDNHSFNGAWGVYPYLPSGNWLVSDMENGLYVVKTSLKRACYLEGTVREKGTNVPVELATIQLINTSTSEQSKADGNYATGIAEEGMYTVRVSKSGYYPQTIAHVHLHNGMVTALNIDLESYPRITFEGRVLQANNAPIANAQVNIRNGDLQYQATSNENGYFRIPRFALTDVPSTISVAKWGYIGFCSNGIVKESIINKPIVLEKGYADDFSCDLGWERKGNATQGRWVREKPIGTTYKNLFLNPYNDVNNDCDEIAYLTGNAHDAYIDDDVDNGYVELTSQDIDLSGYTNPTLSYWRWFSNISRSATSPVNDSLTVYLQKGEKRYLLEKRTMSDLDYKNEWQEAKFNLKRLGIPLEKDIQLVVSVTDTKPNHYVKGGIDNLRIQEQTAIPDENAFASHIRIFPNPSTSNMLNIQLDNLDAKQASQNLEVSVWDAMGRVVHREVVKPTLEQNKGQIHIASAWQAGVYWIVLKPLGSELSPSTTPLQWVKLP